MSETLTLSLPLLQIDIQELLREAGCGGSANGGTIPNSTLLLCENSASVNIPELLSLLNCTNRSNVDASILLVAALRIIFPRNPGFGVLECPIQGVGLNLAILGKAIYCIWVPGRKLQYQTQIKANLANCYL